MIVLWDKNITFDKIRTRDNGVFYDVYRTQVFFLCFLLGSFLVDLVLFLFTNYNSRIYNYFDDLYTEKQRQISIDFLFGDSDRGVFGSELW